MSEQTSSKVPQIRFRGFDGEWLDTTFKMACSLLTGHPFQSKLFTKSGIFLVRGMNVKRGYLDASAQISEYWSCSNGLELFLLKEDDIVIQMDGALIGKSYARIRQENLPALLVQRVTRARCENASNSDYVYQYIERDFLKYIRANKTETAVPHLSLDDIREFPISLSSQDEQTQIGKYFRELDYLIGLHQRKHDKLVTLKKAMLQKMFPQPGATTPEIRFKGFSGPWDTIAMEKLGQTYSGLFGKTKDDFGRGDGRFVTYTGVFNHTVSNLNVTDAIGVDPSQNEVRKGDVLFTISSETPHEVGMSSVWAGDAKNVYLNSFCFGFRPLPSLKSDFLAYVFRADEFRKRICLLGGTCRIPQTSRINR
jgi:type I restriction enzyme S subunit